MNQWLTAMGIDNGGKTYKLVREQSRRLSLCRLTFYRVTDEATIVTNGSFVRDAILPNRDRDDGQLPLWQEAIRLDEGFYQKLDRPLSAAAPGRDPEDRAQEHGARRLRMVSLPPPPASEADSDHLESVA